MFGLIGTTFRKLDWKTIIFFERALDEPAPRPDGRRERCHVLACSLFCAWDDMDLIVTDLAQTLNVLFDTEDLANEVALSAAAAAAAMVQEAPCRKLRVS